MKRKLTVLFLILALVCTLAAAALADFGGYSSDYDYDYDYGWDDDDDWDWDDDDDDWDWDWDWSWDDDDDDDDWRWSSSGSGGSGGSGGSSSSVEVSDALSTALGAIIFFGIIGLIIWSAIRKSNQHTHTRTRSGVSAGTSQKFEAPKLRPMSEYYALDPTFSGDALKERCANLYVQMQNCWTAKDLAPLEPYFTDAFLSQMNRQLDNMRRAGRTNYVEDICVLGVDLIGFNQQGGSDHMFARVTARIIDYTLDDASGDLVSGDRSRQKHMTYEWNLIRATGQTTASNSGAETVNCPNCGAPLAVNASARCPYCGSILQRGASDWALCGIRGLRQQSK